jgi:transposase
MISAQAIASHSVEELQRKIDSLEETNHSYEVENNLLREQIQHLKSKLFGRKTEKRKDIPDNGQAWLFNEAETFQAPEEEIREEIHISAHSRKKRGRRPLPDNLPQVDVKRVVLGKRSPNSLILLSLPVCK